MICDKCLKKDVCRIFADGKNISGCVAYLGSDLRATSTGPEPPANWSGLWINRKEAMVWLTDCCEQYMDYQNEYEHGLHDAYYNAEDYISGMEGHD